MDFPSNNRGLDMDYDDYDVIIVGGGLTGLSAAYHIMKKHSNLSLMIIESQDSVGGRLKSGEGFEPIIHSFQNNINQLLRELKIETEMEVCEDKIPVYYDKNGPFDSIPSIFSSQVYYFIKSLNESSLNPKFDQLEYDEEFEQLAETSINDLIDRMVLSSRAKSICRSLMSLTCGFERLENVSVLWILRVLHGAGGLFQRLKYFLGGNSRYFVKVSFKVPIV